MATTIARLQAILSADTRDFDRAMKSSESRMHKTGKVAGLAGLAIAGGLAIGLKKSADAAQDAEIVQSRMESQMKALGISYKNSAKQIDQVINRTSKLAAVDDEELAQSFTRLLPATKNVNQALTQMGLAADIARAQNISLESATKLVVRANTGSAGALRRLGISLVKVTENVDAAKKAQMEYKSSHKEVSDEMKVRFAEEMRNARALDLRAQAEVNIATLQKTFKGAAEDYGKTSAASQERIQVAVENLQESLGKLLLPAIKRVLDEFTRLANFLTEHEKVTKILVIGLAGLAAALLGVSAATKAASAAAVLGKAAFIGLGEGAAIADKLMRLTLIGALITLGIGLVVAYQKSETFRDIVNKALEGVRVAADKLADAFRWFRDHSGQILDVLSKHPAWLLIKGQFNLLVTVGEKVLDIFRWVRDKAPIAMATAKEALDGPLQAIASAFDKVADAIGAVRDAMEWIRDHGSSIIEKASGFISGVVGKLPGRGDVAAGFNAAAAAIARTRLGEAAGALQPQTQRLFGQISAMFGNVLMTSGFRTKAQNDAVDGATNSDHLTGRAFDIIPATGWNPASIALFDRIAAWLAGLDSVRWIGWRGVPGHGPGDHLHVSTYDQGGWLPPRSTTMAINRTNQWEPVGPPGAGGVVVHLTNQGVLGSEAEVTRWIQNAFTRWQRRGGGSAFG